MYENIFLLLGTLYIKCFILDLSLIFLLILQLIIFLTDVAFAKKSIFIKIKIHNTKSQHDQLYLYF